MISKERENPYSNLQNQLKRDSIMHIKNSMKTDQSSTLGIPLPLYTSPRWIYLSLFNVLGLDRRELFRSTYLESQFRLSKIRP